MRKLLNKSLLVALIFFLALVLRLVRIDGTPPSLNWDEVSHGYNAYSILETNKDEWGNTYPSIFRAYGDYKLPSYIYLTAFSEYVLGVNTLAVRLPAVLAGLGVVIFTYLLTRQLLPKKENLAIIASLLVAIEPWSFFVSRGAFEANLALFYIVGGAYFFLRGIRESGYLIASSLFFGLSLWTYNSARVFVPLFLFTLFFIYRKDLIKVYKKKTKAFVYSILIALLFFVPMLIQLLNPQGQARYSKVAIIDQGAVAQINEQRRVSELSPVLNRAFNNKGTYFAREFTKNYFSHFSPEFLFFKGGDHFQFSVPGFGLLYLINIPFFLAGIVILVRKKSKESAFLLSWLLISPIASSVTREAPHVLRSIVMLPIPMILSAVGFKFFLDQIKAKKKTLIAIIYLIAVVLFAHKYLANYFNDYRANYSWSWQYGYEQVVNYAKENYDDYEKIVVTKKYGEPHEFFLFHWPWDPDNYINDSNVNRFYQSGWYWVDSFDKFFFVNDWQIVEEGVDPMEFNLESGGLVDCSQDSCLLITSPGNVSEGWELVETINFLDNKPAFEIYNNVQE